MLRQLRLLLVVFVLPCVLATWKDEHVVTGLPTLNGPDVTSYAGIVPVREDLARDIEVSPFATPD